MRKFITSIILALLTVAAFGQTAQPSFNWVKFVGSDSTSGAVTVNGTMRFNPVSGKFRFRQGGTWVGLGAGASGSSTFVGLTDGPGSFSGKSLNYFRVNTGETALEYRTPSQVRSDIGAQATITPGALTKTDDTNVTLTLGGTPTTALLQATSITAGWTGTLSGTRGGTGVNNGSNTITLAGNLVTSGANSLTLTTSGTTNVTLPTTGTLATRAGTETFTNKRITPRLQSVTSSATVTPDADANDAVKITAQAAGLTLANPSGTPDPMQAMVIRLKDNGTARSITWGSQYRGIGLSLPSTTVISKTMYFGLVWNADDSKWDVVGYQIEF